MKRFFKYNSLVAVVFLLLWTLLVVLDVKTSSYGSLIYIFYGSLPLIFLAFFFATWRALRGSSKHPAGYAILTSVVMSPVIIYVGVTLAVNFFFLIGGTK